MPVPKGRTVQRVAMFAACLVSSPLPAWSQASEPAGPVGFAADELDGQDRFEQELLRTIRPDSIGRWARTLAASPHVAGTPGQVATRDSVIRWHAAAGVEAGYDSLVLYLPHPLHVSVQRTWPEPAAFNLDEPALDVDPATTAGAVPVFNAYSGSGVAAGDLVFA